MRSAKALLVVLFVFLATPVLLQAQTATTAVVSGTVSDPTGAVVAGAEVVMLETATGVSRSQPTNAAGQYVFVNLAPGNYKLTVTMQGFRQATVPSLKVEVAKAHLLNITLEVGAVAETVEVTAMARVELQTVDATVGNVISNRDLARMPTFTRQANELLTMQPGVTMTGEVTGSRSDQSTFALDGIDVTNQSVGGLGTYMQLPIDAVEEFRVSVANPNAAFGRGAGGQVSILGRRGSNDFHGATFWYHQNDNLNSTVWQNNRTIGLTQPDLKIRKKLQKPELKDNRFGFRVGGPVIKDKAFFFLMYEGRRFPRTTEFTRLVPTDTLRQGVLRFRDASGAIVSYNMATSTLCGAAGNQACDPRGLGLSPSIAALWAKLPAGNDVSGGDGLNTIFFRGIVRNPIENDYFNGRFDYQLSNTWRANGTIRYFTQMNTGATLLSIIGGDIRSREIFPTRQNMMNFGLVGQITPTLTADFAFGWLRIRTATDRQRPNVSAGVLAIPGTETTAQNHSHIALDLGALGGQQNLLGEPIDVNTQVARKQANDNHNYQWNADLTWVKARHTVQFGSHLRYLPTLHLRDDKVLGSLGALVAQVDADLGAFSVPTSSQPRGCIGGVTTNCLRTADVQQWDRLLAASMGMVDNISILAVRDGAFKPLPFGSLLESDTKLWAPEFYVQDTWRIRPSLTLTFGINYGWQQYPTERLGRYSLMINKDTGEFLSSKSFLAARRQAAEKGQLFNPEFAFMPIKSSGRKGVFNIDWNNWAPRLAAAWNPSYTGGFLGRLFGDRKTVIRGGYGLIYDRQNTVQSVIVPSLGVAFAQTLNVNAPACNATGAGGAGCNSTSSNPVLRIFRVGRDGTMPVPVVPAQSVPVSPPWCRTGSSACIFPEILSFQVDPFIEVGENHAVDVTWQRELPRNMLLEVGYAGRFARKLPQSMNFGQIPYMQVDTASGQTFAQAFDAVATQLRSGVAAASVTLQPWFENQVPQGTRALATAQRTNFINGNLNSIFLAIDLNRMANARLPFNNWMSRTFFLRSSTGLSNYNGVFVTLRRRMSEGLMFDVSYTLSRSLDQFGAIQNAASVMPNSFDLNAEYGPSDFDITHILLGKGLYELPFRSSVSALNKVIGGWYVSSIFRANSGDPLTVTEGSQVWGGSHFLGFSSGAVPTVDPGTFTNSVQRGVTGSNNIGTNSNAAGTPPGTGLNLFQNPEQVSNSFRRVLVGQDGRSGRSNPLRGMPRWNVDFSLGKKTAVTESVSILFSLDFFNVLNHVNFNNPSLDLRDPRPFGVISSQFTPADRTNGARWIQFGLRVEF